MQVRFLAIALVFCSTSIVAQSVQPQFEYRALPAPGEIHTVSPGEVLLDSSRYYIRLAARLLDTPVSSGSLAQSVLFRVGQVVSAVPTSRAFKGCSSDAAIGYNTASPCLIDDDGDGTFDRMSSTELSKASQMASSVRYEVIPGYASPTTEGMTRRLLYQGASQGELRISYREFLNGTARDPFSEELVIPLEDTFPQQVAVKGVVLTIYKISSLGMDYDVVSIKAGMGWGEP